MPLKPSLINQPTLTSSLIKAYTPGTNVVGARVASLNIITRLKGPDLLSYHQPKVITVLASKSPMEAFSVSCLLVSSALGFLFHMTSSRSGIFQADSDGSSVCAVFNAFKTLSVIWQKGCTHWVPCYSLLVP